MARNADRAVLYNINVEQGLPPGLPPHTPVTGRRPLLFERFLDNSAYALNSEHPTGVIYFRPAAADRLAEVLRTHGNPPCDSVVPLLSKSQEEERLFRKLLATEAQQSIRHDRRLNVWFHVSNSCNLACSYCYIPHLRKAVQLPAEGSLSPKEVLTEGIKSLFHLCSNRGFQGIHLRFGGGEPLLALDQIEIACDIATSQSDESGIAVTFALLTNGTLISDRFLKLLKRYNFRGISISVDGMSEAHDEYRFQILEGNKSRRGTWETIFNNIRILKESGHSPYILTTLTSSAYSGRSRSAFRTDGDRDSNLMAITIPK